nr:transmembrane and TPR repeat-containing protein CG4341-like [Halyomorpha halys]
MKKRMNKIGTYPFDVAHLNLGTLLASRGRIQEAEEVLIRQREILEVFFRKVNLVAHLNLGTLLASRGRIQEAEEVLIRCSLLDGSAVKDPRTHESTRVSSLVHLGRIYADRGDHAKAVQVYSQAVAIKPKDYQPQVLYNLLGESLGREGRHEEAERWFKAALSAKPDHVPAHLTYGKLLAKNRTRISEAEQWFIRAKKLAPTDPSVYFHFGQFLSERQRHTEAASLYLKAAELAPEQYESVLGAATALRQAGRNQEAELFYRKAAQLRPNDASSHSNLGAMLHLNGKASEAAAAYREALRLDPTDSTTMANLRKLHSVRPSL